MRRFAVAAFVLIALAPRVAAAGDDVDLIPDAVLAPPPEPPPAEPAKTPAPPRRATLDGKFFLEDAFSVWTPTAHVPVPYPKALARDWQNRTSFDAAFQWKPLPRLTFSVSDRLNAFEEDGQKLLSRNTIRNDLREASVAWEAIPNGYLEGGRVNVRNGAALGFNPTDFFKTRSLVGQASLDPSVIRQNRLGALMVRAQKIWSGGSAAVAYAPEVTDPSPLVKSDPLGIDPRFDATNGSHRVLCTLGFDLWDLSPQLLGYFELHRSKLGANVSRPIGDAVIAYAEWAGGPEQSLIARANAFGHDTGTLPASVPILPPSATNMVFRNDVASGFSWTVAAKVTFNAEYHFHDAAFGRDDWRNWFNRGSAPNAPPGVASTLWFVRGYANDQQEPISQHQLFVRASWPRAFVTELELTGFAFVSLLDASVLSQLSANYYLSDAWTASAYVSANFGEGRSERGSFPQRGNAILQITRYL